MASPGIPITIIRDPDVITAAGTNTIGAVKIESADSGIRLPLYLAEEPKNGNSVVIAVQPVDDEGNVLRQSTLEDILASVSSGTLYEATLFNAVSAPGASPAAYVGGRLHHVVQHVITGTVAVQTRSSLDGVHWHIEAIDTASTVHSLEGATKYMSAEYITGNGVLTTLIASAK